MFSSSVILFITMGGTILMVFLVLTCYRIFMILFRKEQDRDKFISENRKVIYSAPRWPVEKSEQIQWKVPPAYKDSQPPPYYFVVGGPEIQQPETWNLPTDGTLLIQRA
ncbi:hypothetical protein L798_12895 [Zootermopsis nevadensis]|uniref:Uncharacterized protein n=1 Tax=Zootermopsis nevadensis TaxID=136037 RepID=A0A067R4N7_ZOONE|nr:hypothetical protein L798_12895 [Zootermopsis nevadensis]